MPQTAPAAARSSATNTGWRRAAGRFSAWMRVGLAARAATVPNLTNGASYVFEVRAVNRIGTSRASNRVEC